MKGRLASGWELAIKLNRKAVKKLYQTKYTCIGIIVKSKILMKPCIIYYRIEVRCDFCSACGHSHALQQQHYGVQLLPGSVIGPQRYDEVVEAVPCALGRHDDQFVLEAVRARVLIGHMVTGLVSKEKTIRDQLEPSGSDKSATLVQIWSQIR